MTAQITPTPTDHLEALRARLDAVDVTLLNTLRDRIALCVEIAVHKREHGVPMMQPHRIGVVQRRAADFGLEHGIDLDFLRNLYDLIIAETCRVEDEVIGTPA
jgi:chorismate mutase-like protein